MKRSVLLSLLTIPLCAPFASAAPQTPQSTQAVSASKYQRPKWTEADKKTLLARAQHGDADAQFWLGVPKNYVLAAQWYRKAAEHVPDLGGAGQGRNNLGLLYLQGLGVPKDYVQAYMWFSLAGVESNVAAQEEMNPEQIFKARHQRAMWIGRNETHQTGSA